MRASHISSDAVTSRSKARKAAARQARLALNVYAGKTKPTLKVLAILCGFPAWRLYQLRYRRKHNGGHKRNGGNQSIPNGGAAPTLADRLASASPSERAEAAARIGVATVWDQMVSPLIDEERASQNGGASHAIAP
jgi:hypothetical protein